MILFKGYFGTILYSGDFRFHKNIIKNNPFLFDEKSNLKYQVD